MGYLHLEKHFLSSITGLPKTFPIANWCCLTDQTDFTLNMLWPCHQNPALYAFKALEGSYLFDATPMAPLGTKVLAHHKPNQRLSWGFHALNAWCISPSLQHYWCIKIIMHNTGGECITDTFQYKHHTIPVPVITATDSILKVTHQLTAAIEGIQDAAPDELEAIESLCHILLVEQIPQQLRPPTPTSLNDLTSMRNQSICGIHLSPLSPSCPPMQPKGCLKLDMPSFRMMMHHLTLFLQYIRAAPPSLTTKTMHQQWSDAHGLELNYALN